MTCGKLELALKTLTSDVIFLAGFGPGRFVKIRFSLSFQPFVSRKVPLGMVPISYSLICFHDADTAYLGLRLHLATELMF